MSNILLLMKRTIIADSLLKRLSLNGNLTINCENDYDKAKDLIYCTNPHVVLLEAAENPEYGVAYCLALIEELKKISLDTKFLLMCSEQDKTGVEEVLCAKENALIDDFIFYDSSIDYLALKLILS